MRRLFSVVAVLLTLKLPGLVATTQEATPTAIGDGMPQAYHGMDNVTEVGEQERSAHRRMERKADRVPQRPSSFT